MLIQRDFEPGQLTAGTFFGDVCPKLLRQRKEQLAKLGGTFGFVVRGRKGGQWTLDFDRANVVPRLTRGKVDVCVELEHNDFDALLKGTLDVVGAFRAGRLVVTGERSKLRALPHVLLN